MSCNTLTVCASTWRFVGFIISMNGVISRSAWVITTVVRAVAYNMCPEQSCVPARWTCAYVCVSRWKYLKKRSKNWNDILNNDRLCPVGANQLYLAHREYPNSFVNNVSLPYLTFPSGWAGCYTCPALRPYQFGPMRNPDVTRRSLWSAIKPKHRLWSRTNHQPPGTGDV